ncbi:MAG: hypothetical protein MRJ92_02815 [Nitrospira sp.]|nr:hypothetical protein [Nitrospira sp.]
MLPITLRAFVTRPVELDAPAALFPHHDPRERSPLARSGVEQVFPRQVKERRRTEAMIEQSRLSSRLPAVYLLGFPGGGNGFRFVVADTPLFAPNDV